MLYFLKQRQIPVKYKESVKRVPKLGGYICGYICGKVPMCYLEQLLKTYSPLHEPI